MSSRLKKKKVLWVGAGSQVLVLGSQISLPLQSESLVHSGMGVHLPSV